MVHAESERLYISKCRKMHGARGTGKAVYFQTQDNALMADRQTRIADRLAPRPGKRIEKDGLRRRIEPCILLSITDP